MRPQYGAVPRREAQVGRQRPVGSCGLACGPDVRERVVGPGPLHRGKAFIEPLHCMTAAGGRGGEVSVPHAARTDARRLSGRPQVAIRLSSCSVGVTSSDLGVHGLGVTSSETRLSIHPYSTRGGDKSRRTVAVGRECPRPFVPRRRHVQGWASREVSYESRSCGFRTSDGTR